MRSATNPATRTSTTTPARIQGHTRRRRPPDGGGGGGHDEDADGGAGGGGHEGDGGGGHPCPGAPVAASVAGGVASASPSVASGSDILGTVTDDVATDAARGRGATQRRRRVTLAGHLGDTTLARQGLSDPDPRVHVAALGALARLGELTTADVVRALADGTPAVRRRAVDAAGAVRGRGARSVLPEAVASALADPDPLVVVGAAWFLGERRHRPAVPALATVATEHADPRCREAAIAALGAIGDPAGLPAVLTALGDKPTVRRRATVALAGFEDPRVEPALRAAARDRDWQVRQAAEELLSPPG